tara:strand:- start:344 stop:583 length:240 start_codon:yes stop_codon:yes gene_type:complete
MKEKNLPDDIRSKSLDDLTEEVDKIIEQLEKTNNLENSIDQYNKLIKLNNFIEKKFQTISKQINLKTKEKINNIIKKND